MKVGKSIIFGALSGAAAAIFLQTEKGKEVKEKVLDAVDRYKEDPEKYQQEVIEKTVDLKDKAVEKVSTVLEDPAIDGNEVIQNLQTKAAEVAEDVRNFVANTLETVEEDEEVEVVEEDTAVTPDEDIIIDYKED